MAEPKQAQRDMLIAFTNGSYKTIKAPFEWKQSEWIHFKHPDGRTVRVNTSKVKYLEEV